MSLSHTRQVTKSSVRHTLVRAPACRLLVVGRHLTPTTIKNNNAPNGHRASIITHSQCSLSSFSLFISTKIVRNDHKKLDRLYLNPASSTAVCQAWSKLAAMLGRTRGRKLPGQSNLLSNLQTGSFVVYLFQKSHSRRRRTLLRRSWRYGVWIWLPVYYEYTYEHL